MQSPYPWIWLTLTTPGDFVVQLKDYLQSTWGTNRLDFLINNAGMGAIVPFLQATETLFDKFLNVHFKSIYF